MMQELPEPPKLYLFYHTHQSTSVNVSLLLSFLSAKAVTWASLDRPAASGLPHKQASPSQYKVLREPPHGCTFQKFSGVQESSEDFIRAYEAEDMAQLCADIQELQEDIQRESQSEASQFSGHSQLSLESANQPSSHSQSSQQSSQVNLLKPTLAVVLKVLQFCFALITLDSI